MRAGGAAGVTDEADAVALLKAVADFHVEARHMKVAGRNTVTVVEDHRAAREVHVLFSHRDDRADRGVDGYTLACRYVGSEVRALGNAVQDVVVAKRAVERARTTGMGIDIDLAQ